MSDFPSKELVSELSVDGHECRRCFLGESFIEAMELLALQANNFKDLDAGCERAHAEQRVADILAAWEGE